MKNNEAIEILEYMAMAESTFSDEESKKCCEAIDIAIKALKREEAKCDVSLTLEQLQKMDGKPVWVEFTGSKIERESGWFILKYMNGQEAHLVGKVNTYKSYEYYGKTWVAYAYPPVHIDLEALCGSWEGEADGYADGELVYDVWRCSGCKHVEENDDPDLLPDFCPDCGIAMTEKARSILGKRLKEAY